MYDIETFKETMTRAFNLADRLDSVNNLLTSNEISRDGKSVFSFLADNSKSAQKRCNTLYSVMSKHSDGTRIHLDRTTIKVCHDSSA